MIELNKLSLLVDLSNIAWSTFHTNQNITKDSTFTPAQIEQHWIYLMFDKLMRLKLKHKPDEIVICFDSASWRLQFFPYYKARRKLAREKSGMDREGFQKTLEKFAADLAEFFPYKVMKVKYAEADDIIAILAREIAATGSKVIIASRDKDFKQLLNKSISLWDVQEKKFVKCNNPKNFLIRHILTGDSGDDVPNVRSDDDVFITDGKRQKPCGPKTCDKILQGGLEDWVRENGLIQNWKRNKRLIRLSKNTIPDSIWENVVSDYKSQPDEKANYNKISNYFAENRQRQLYKNIDKFI